MNLPIKQNKNTVPTSVALTKDQVKFLKKHNINLSELIRTYLDQVIKQHEESKS